MTRAEEFRAAVLAEDPDARVGVRGDRQLLVFTEQNDEAWAVRSIRRMRSARRFKDVAVVAVKVDGQCC